MNQLRSLCWLLGFAGRDGMCSAEAKRMEHGIMGVKIRGRDGSESEFLIRPTGTLERRTKWTS